MTMKSAMNATTTEPTAMVMTSSMSVKPRARRSAGRPARLESEPRISSSSGSRDSVTLPFGE